MIYNNMFLGDLMSLLHLLNTAYSNICIV